jgi:hypothetical protein
MEPAKDQDPTQNLNAAQNQGKAKNQDNSGTDLNPTLKLKSPMDMVSVEEDSLPVGVLTAEEIHLLEKSGLTLEDAIQAIESSEA